MKLKPHAVYSSTRRKKLSEVQTYHDLFGINYVREPSEWSGDYIYRASLDYNEVIVCKCNTNIRNKGMWSTTFVIIQLV